MPLSLPYRRSSGFTLGATLFLLSCGDNPVGPPGAPPTVPPPTGTGAVSGVISPAGGTLSAVTSEGATVALTFPAGAVREATQVTIRPLEAGEGLRMQVALEPAGLVFRKAFTLSVVLPSGADPATTLLMLNTGADRVFLPTGKNAAERRLTAALSFFGFGEQASGSSVDFDRLVASNHSGGNTVGAGAASCQQLAASGQASFNSYLSQKQFEQAVAAALNAGALLAEARCFDEAQSFVSQAMPAACAGLEDLIKSLEGAITSYGEFETTISELLAWAALLQRLEGDCTAADWAEALHREALDFVDFAAARAQAITAPNYVAFLDLRDEARRIIAVRTKAQMLALTDAADLIEGRAFYPTLHKMRAVGYTLCREQQWQYPLSRLTTVGFFAGRDILGVPSPRPGDVTAPGQYAEFSDQDIYADLQYCGTELTLVSVVASGGPLASESVGSQGVPGPRTTDITLTAPTRGKLRLEGRLFGLTCWNDVAADQEITIELNGIPVHTLARSGIAPYLDGTSLELEIAALAEAAGITPREGFPADLVVRRRRTACDDDLWGPRNVVLFEATLQWKNPELEVEVKLPVSLPVGGQVEAEVRVKVIDQLDQAGFFDAIDVALGVQGGTALHATGQTDPQGYFRTMIQLPASSHAAGGSFASADDSGLSVTATATSFEGVTAQATAVVNIGCRTVGTVYAYTQTQLNQSAGVCVIDAELVLSDVRHNGEATVDPIVDLTPLAGLTRVGGSITIWGTRVTAVDLALESTRGSIVIEGNQQLTDLRLDIGGIEGSFSEISNGIWVHGNNALTNVSVRTGTGIPKVRLSFLPALNELDVRIGGGEAWQISIAHTGLTRITRFDLTRVRTGPTFTDGFWMYENPNLVDMEAFRNLTSTGRILSIHHNPELCVPEWVSGISAGTRFIRDNKTQGCD